MLIDPTARREAQDWYTNPRIQTNHSLKECPVQLGEAEKQHELDAIKPEFYGRSASIIIDQLLSRSFQMREARGELGFIRLNSPYVRQAGNIVEPDEISSMEDLGEAFYQTLLTDLRIVTDAIRTKEHQEHFDWQQFDEFISLDGLARYRSALSGHGFGSINTSIAAGAYTATSRIAKLIPLMVEATAESDPFKIILNSYKPLMRIASIGPNHLEYFDTTYLLASSELPLFVRTSRGTLDILPEIIKDIELQPTEHGPVIGCPVLFGRSATKELWQWGVTAAERSGLLRPELYR